MLYRCGCTELWLLVAFGVSDFGLRKESRGRLSPSGNDKESESFDYRNMSAIALQHRNKQKPCHETHPNPDRSVNYRKRTNDFLKR